MLLKRRCLALISPALLLAGCGAGRPPQSGFYCLDVPAGRIADVQPVVQATAERLDYDVSQSTFSFAPDNIQYTFEIYGKGISLFIESALKSGRPDRFGNRPTKFDPRRYSVQAVKTGWWQRASFDEALKAVAVEAHSARASFSKAPNHNACAT